MLEASMTLERETKGAVRYQEVRDGTPVDIHDAVIGTLYIRKAALTGPVPKYIRVTVEPVS